MQGPESLKTTEIIELLRNKVARNPGDLEAYLMLGSTLYKAGDLAGSAAAFQSLLNQRPEHFQALLLLARTQARAGKIVTALSILAHAQRVDPANSQAWQVAAALATDIRDWVELLRIGEGWTRAHVDSVSAWQALSRAHFEETRFSDAIVAFDQVLKLEPGNPSHLVAAAQLAIAAQRYRKAREYLDAAQKVAPDSPELLYTLGRLHHMTGELVAAEECYRHAIDARPGFATAYVELGTLREGRLEDTELQAVNRMFEDSAVHPEYRVMLGFTLGNALDRRGESAQAFTAWARANEINHRISSQEGFVYSPEMIESEANLIAEIFADPFELESAPPGPAIAKPIFVVGMPRTGTTLIESVLASHSEVYGAGELPTLYDIHEELIDTARQRGVAAARDLLVAAADGWRKRYLEALTAIGAATCVVDKQPLNYRSIGLIRLLFPHSPVIYCRRSPMDVGLSIYRHKFSKSWPCAHSLPDIGHYYGVHARIFKLWEERYPDASLTVDHADMVNNPRAVISRVLSFAGLSSEPACYKPHQTSRPIATFSSVQVRQPLSSSFSGQAKRYANQLAPLREALESAGIDVNE